MNTAGTDDREAQAAIERLPLIGRWLAEGVDAWLGVADALNLGGLRGVLLADPRPAHQPRSTPAALRAAATVLGPSTAAAEGAPAAPCSDRAA